MKPVVVSITVPQAREEVFAFLDVMANHELFTDHFLVDWSYDGPATGVGAKARMRLKGGRNWADMKVVEAEAPRTIVEEALSAGGRRRTRGTYLLDALPDGGTKISFEFQFVDTVLLDRVVGPLALARVRSGNQRAMERLAEQLAKNGGSAS